ncbi:MAG: sulfotransferase [Chloroflexi bacterium HGW-Chloroflexi-3]|nr:MAG: sulfotransferase [Chloroflexi bacterium HGW-Chloroflexi-3]
MNIPNFLIIGAAKSGTTALYRYLKQHPEIFMPDRKEPHHFSFDDITKNTKGPGDYVRTAITDKKEYQSLFSSVNNQKAVGEASPTYIYVPGTAERIYSELPNSKLIAILRNPADRAFSAYMHLVRDGYETVFDFSEALNLENERIKKNWGPIWHYKKAGLYHEQLTSYFNLFRNNQILIIIYDDYKKDPSRINKSIFNFLNVDESFLPDMSAKPNVSGIPKNIYFQRIMSYFFDRDNIIRTFSRNLFSEEIRWRVTSYIRNHNLQKIKMSPEVRSGLVDYFRNDINKLQNLINRDLSHWLIY